MKNPLKHPKWRRSVRRVYRAIRVIVALASAGTLAFKVWKFVKPWLVELIW